MFLSIITLLVFVSCQVEVESQYECNNDTNYIAVDTSRKTLTLCEQGAASNVFRVMIGKNGPGKTKKGDMKTPIGEYSLARPRSSISGFRTFIHIVYPNARDVARGSTGGSIGIHGPSSRYDSIDGLPALTWLQREFGWTLGCISLTTNDDIDEIESWVIENDVKKIEIF